MAEALTRSTPALAGIALVRWRARAVFNSLFISLTTGGCLFASTASATCVPLVLFFGLQRQYVQGVTGAGLKA